jgi:hypothetical protein
MKKICFLLLIMAPGLVTIAQRKPPQDHKAKPVLKVAKEEPLVGMPALVTKIGVYKGGDVLVDDAKKLLDSALRVTDDKVRTYTIVNYKLLYRKKERTEDQATGKQKSFYDLTVFKHTVTPMPQSWRTLMKEGLQQTETITFDDIIVRSKDGRKFKAPAIKLQLL